MITKVTIAFENGEEVVLDHESMPLPEPVTTPAEVPAEPEAAN